MPNLIASLLTSANALTAPGSCSARAINTRNRPCGSNNVLLGNAQQLVSSLTALQSVLDISNHSGIANALNNLFQSFAAWGQSPNSTVARQSVIDRATDLDAAFRQTAAGLATIRQDTEQQLQQTVATVNELVGKLRNYTAQIGQTGSDDAGRDALYNTLEHFPNTSTSPPRNSQTEA